MFFTLQYWCTLQRRWYEEDIGPMPQAAAVQAARRVHAQRRAPVALYDAAGALIYDSRQG